MSLATGLMQLNTNYIEIKSNTDEEIEYLVHPHRNDPYLCEAGCNLVLDIHNFAEKEGYSTESLSSGSFLTSSVVSVRTLKILMTKFFLRTIKPARYFSSVQFSNAMTYAELVVTLWPDNVEKDEEIELYFKSLLRIQQYLVWYEVKVVKNELPTWMLLPQHTQTQLTITDSSCT